MTGDATELAIARLRAEYIKAIESGTLGGSRILSDLADLTYSCCRLQDDKKCVVAIALTAVLQNHAHYRDESAVTNEFLPSHDIFSDAVSFIVNGGSIEDAFRVAAALARALSGPSESKKAG